MKSKRLAIISPTKKVRELYRNLIKEASEAIPALKNDEQKLKDYLLNLIDRLPKEAYVDADTLQCFDIPSEISLWVCPDDDLFKETIQEFKDYICDIDSSRHPRYLAIIFGEVYQLYLDGEL